MKTIENGLVYLQSLDASGWSDFIWSYLWWVFAVLELILVINIIIHCCTGSEVTVYKQRTSDYLCNFTGFCIGVLTIVVVLMLEAGLLLLLPESLINVCLQAWWGGLLIVLVVLSGFVLLFELIASLNFAFFKAFCVIK